MLLLQSVVNVHFLFSFLEKKGIKAVTSAVPLKNVHICILCTPEGCMLVINVYILVHFEKVPPQC